MPDRIEGYTHRGADVCLPNAAMAAVYERSATESELQFTPVLQEMIIEELHAAAKFQQFRVHGIATEPTHVHALVSWRDERPWQKLRGGIRESLSRQLNRELMRKKSLSSGASRKHVQDREHFDYLMGEYLPGHSGKNWKASDRK